MKYRKLFIPATFVLFCFFMQAITSAVGPDDRTLTPCVEYGEQVTLITDRSLYMAGEDIWFSASLQCGNDSAQSCLSRILYIDIYKEPNGISIKQKLKIEDSRAAGSVSIPSNFPTGRYYMRAYTNYQKNYPVENLTCNEILILNPEIPLRAPVRNDPAEIFFKGGSAIYGLPAQAALQVNYKANSIGYAEIITESDTVLTGIRVDKGTGYFEFTPQQNEAYFVKIGYTDNDSLVFPVENIRNSGWHIITRYDEEFFYIVLSATNTGGAMNGSLEIIDPFLQTVFSDKFFINGNSWECAVPARLLEADMHYIGIKDKDEKLILFTEVRHPSRKTVTLHIETDKEVYSPFETVEVVVNKPAGTTGIFRNLVASAAINGSSHSSVTEHGSNDFSEALAIIHENAIRQNPASLQKIFARNTQWSVRNLPEIRDVSFTGLVLRAGTKEPVGHCRVYLSVLGDDPQLHVYDTRDDGSFIFTLNNLTGNRKLFVGVDYLQYPDAEILINSDFIREYIPPGGTLTFSAADHALYEELFVNYQVAKKSGTHTKHLDIGGFRPQPIFTHPDISILLSDYIELPTMRDVFNEIVLYTYLREKKGLLYFQLKNPETDVLINQPLVLFDNVPVFDISSILDVSPETIGRIDIIYHSYLLGSHKFNGVVNIVSKESQLENIVFSGGTVFFDYQTVNPSFEFVLPEKQETSGPVPQFNNLLYWEAGLTLGQSPLKLEFITGNNETEYKIIIQGTTPEGIPCYGEKVIRIKRE